MDKDKNRTKLWCRKQMYRHCKHRLLEYTSYGDFVIVENGREWHHSTWQELAESHWAKIFKTTGTPCSCWMCRNYLYNRREFKKDTRRIIRESED